MEAIAAVIEGALRAPYTVVSRHDAAGNYQEIHGPAEAVLGRTAAELLGRNAYPWFFEEDIPIISAHHDGALLDTMDGCWVRYRLKQPDGSTRWIESRTIKAYGEDENITLLVLTRRVEDQDSAIIVDADGQPVA